MSTHSQAFHTGGPQFAAQNLIQMEALKTAVTFH